MLLAINTWLMLRVYISHPQSTSSNKKRYIGSLVKVFHWLFSLENISTLAVVSFSEQHYFCEKARGILKQLKYVRKVIFTRGTPTIYFTKFPRKFIKLQTFWSIVGWRDFSI